MIDRSQQRAAKIFSITYLVTYAIIAVANSRFYAPYLKWENGEESARRFITHEQAIHFFLVGAILYGVGVIVLLTALYVILRPVSRGMALFAAFSKLTYALFWLILVLDIFGALRLLGGGGSLRAFGPDALAALAGSQLDSSRDAYYIGFIFNGLGSTLFALLFFQSRYIPRVLALWGVLAFLYEVFCGFGYLFYPNFGAILSVASYELPALSFELLLSLWLLLRGLRPPKKPLTSGQG